MLPITRIVGQQKRPSLNDIRAELSRRALQRGHDRGVFGRWSLQDQDLKPSFGYEKLHERIRQHRLARISVEDVARAIRTAQRIIRGRDVEKHDRAVREPVCEVLKGRGGEVGKDKVNAVARHPARDPLHEFVDGFGGRLLHREFDPDNPPDRPRIFQRHLASLIGTPEIREDNPGMLTPVGVPWVLRQLDITELHRARLRGFGMRGY